MDGFSVDPEVLGGARAGVGRLLRDMSAFSVGGDVSSSVFGHELLAASFVEFRERWGGGVAELARDVEVIHRRLGETVRDYRLADESGASLFRRLLDEEG